MGNISKTERELREKEKNKPYTIFSESRVTAWKDTGFGQPRPMGFELFKIQLVNVVK